MSSFYVGSLVRLSAEFQDAAGFADPTTAVVKVLPPGGTVTTYNDAVKDGTGRYHKDVTATTAGTWYARWETTGVVAAVEVEFEVLPTHFS